MNWNKKLTVFVVLGLVLLGTLAMSGCTEDGSNSNKVIISGSTTVKPVASRAAAVFNEEHDDITVEVSGGGSGHGIASLGKGEADIGMASREVKQSEEDEYPDCDYTDHQIAKDGVAIIVSKAIHDAGVTELSTQEVYDIYTDEINNWQDVGGPDKNIFVVERQEGSGTRETFMDALGLDSVDTDAAKPENAQVKSSVKSSDNAIGYVGLGYVGSDTPAVDLDGVEASEDTIKSGDYPISRSLHMYTDGEPEGAVKEFIDFVMSDEGQQIVAEEDFIPVKGGSNDDDDDDELSGTLTITGSTTVKPIAAAAAQGFMNKYSKVTVEVSGGGSGHGIASLGKGEADIGMASREIKQSEIDEYSGTDFVDNEIAKDGVAIIVSKDIYESGVKDLTTQEVYDIYTSNTNTWDEIGGPSKPIFVVERQEGSGTRETFMDAVGLDSTDSDAAKPENAQVKSAVKSSNNAIGYVGLGYVGSDTPSVKLNGVAPSEENIGSGDYKISRSLHMYTDGEPTGLTKEFIDYIMGDEGQQIVADEGFIPMNSNSNDKKLSGTITITGSTTVQPIAAKAASAFMEKHPKVTVEVSGGGSGHGIASLGNGEADIGMASREIKQSEIDEYSGTDFVDNEIAKDGVAVIVSKEIYDAGVTDLTMQEVYDIYTKKITTWDEVGGPSKPIFVVERQEGSGTRETFMDAVSLDSTQADAAKPENAQVKSAVKTSNNAIGYVGLGYVDSDTPAVKLDGIDPTEENIVNGDYKISRSLHMYTDGEPTGLVKAFIEFVLSEEGQQLVADEGFIPLNN